MKLFLFLDKINNKMSSLYRKKVFKEKISCKHNKFTLVGKAIVINKNIKLGKNVTIYPDVMFFGDGIIEIGDNVAIGNGTIIYSSKDGGVKIGDYSMIAAHCYIIDADHGTSINEKICNQKNNVDKVLIGKDCWLGHSVTVLRGSDIGDGAVVGAMSLVKGVVEENSIVVGVPCRKIKTRV